MWEESSREADTAASRWRVAIISDRVDDDDDEISPCCSRDRPGESRRGGTAARTKKTSGAFMSNWRRPSVSGCFRLADNLAAPFKWSWGVATCRRSASPWNSYAGNYSSWARESSTSRGRNNATWHWWYVSNVLSYYPLPPARRILVRASRRRARRNRSLNRCVARTSVRRSLRISYYPLDAEIHSKEVARFSCARRIVRSIVSVCANFSRRIHLIRIIPTCLYFDAVNAAKMSHTFICATIDVRYHLPL